MGLILVLALVTLGVALMGAAFGARLLRAAQNAGLARLADLALIAAGGLIVVLSL